MFKFEKIANLLSYTNLKIRLKYPNNQIIFLKLTNISTQDINFDANYFYITNYDMHYIGFEPNILNPFYTYEHLIPCNILRQ